MLSLLGLLSLGVGDRSPSYAHGGGLNANGCHSDRKTGSYHCHRNDSGQLRDALEKSTFIAGNIQASVVSVGDGDTIQVKTVGQTINVRLACIDAPEMDQTPYGHQARDQLRALLPKGTLVQLFVQTKDRYGRAVAEVFKGSQNVNQSLVSSGAAFVYWKYVDKCDRSSYLSAESFVRSQASGVWDRPGGLLRPWVHRRER